MVIKNPQALACGFLCYSLDLLELSALLDELLLELSVFVEPSDVLELLALSDELALGADSLLSTFAGRFSPEVDLWSVAYQPEPLNTIPAGVRTFRRLFLLHSGQRFNGSSVND